VALTFDGPNKRIILTAGTVSLSVRDLWSRWVDWWLTSDNSKFLRAMDTVGGNDIDPGTGTKIPVYAFLQNGWRLRPQESNHTLVVGDGVVLVDGGGDPFVDTAGSFIVRINYQQPVQAISFSTGGSGLSPAEQTKLDEIWKLHGLDAGAPLVVSPTARTAGGGITQDITDVAGTTTVERV
jgi:hypothetical protein